MNKSVLYARVSSKEQEEGFSIPAQLKLLLGYAQEKGFEIVQQFIDVESAKSSGRMHFGEMISFLKKNSSVKTILVEKTDRLYRNFKDYVLLEELDLEIHLVKENEIISKNSRSHQKLVHGFKVLMAKNYIDNLREEIAKGMLEKASQGQFPGRPPIGYRANKETKCIELNPETAPKVFKLFEMYSTGNFSLEDIRKLASQVGLKYPSGNAPSMSTLHRILCNPFYYGEFQWHGELYPGKHSPLISRALFEKVQKNLRRGNQRNKGKVQIPYLGLMKCGYCGCSITGEIKKRKYVYYHCTEFKGKCSQPWVRVEEIEELFGNILKDLKLPDQTIQWVKEALVETTEKKEAFRISTYNELRAREQELDKLIERLFIEHVEDKIPEDFFTRKMKEWRGELAEVRENMTRLGKANLKYYDLGIKILELCKDAYSLWNSGNEAQRKKLVRFVLSNCVLKDVTLYPTYKKPFDIIAKGFQSPVKWSQRESNPCLRRERPPS